MLNHCACYLSGTWHAQTQMKFVHYYKCSPETALPKFSLDPDVIKAVYNAMKGLTALGKRTKKKRAEYIASIPRFELYNLCTVTPFQMTTQDGHWNMDQKIAFQIRLDSGRREPCDWSCRLYADFTIFTGSVLPRIYQACGMEPIVNPELVKWHAGVKRKNAVKRPGSC